VALRSTIKILFQLSRFGLVALFLFTAAAKIFTAKDFALNVTNLVGTSWSWPVTIAVIVSELVAAILLISPSATRLGGLWAGMLLLGFAGYALFYVYVQHGEPLECGCFGGIIASQLGVKTALRNLVLLIPTAVVIFGSPASRPQRNMKEETPSG
jgi:hypothetical protein